MQSLKFFSNELKHTNQLIGKVEEKAESIFAKKKNPFSDLVQNFLTNIKPISKITDIVGLSMLYPAPEVWLSVETRGQSTCLDQIIKWKQCCFAFFLENKSCFQRVMASAHHSTHKSKEASFQVVVHCPTLCPQSSPSKQNKPKQHAASAHM